jgi:Secretory lipase
MTTRRTALWVSVAIIATLAVIAAVVWLPIGRVTDSENTGPAASGRGKPVSIASADLSGSGPGSLVSAMTMPGYSNTADGRPMHSARVVYRSTSGDTGEPTVVSGTVFTPLGDAPQDGWPVVSFGHGTLGIQEACGPSLSATLLGQSQVVASLIDMGYAVAMADYQGLGHEGIHPYSDARTAGLNMIDAVRALRHTFADVSDRWAAFGGSQGGGAAWAADEQAAQYAPELKMLGAVAISPAADLSGLVDKAQAGELTADQGPMLQLILASLGRLHPDLNLDDYRHGAAASNWEVLSACSGPEVHHRSAAADALGAQDFSPSTPAAADRLRTLLEGWALPQRPLSAPLYVEYGANDTFIDPQWTTDAVLRACALGGTVEWHEDPESGHSDVDWADAVAWLNDRFQGKRATNGCP